MHKQTVLRDSLLRIGKVEPGTLAEPIRGAVWSYRRKARLGVKYVHRKERVLVGFRERLKPYIADMQRCEVLSDGLESLPEVLAELIGKLSLASELPQVELAVGDESVALVFRILKPATNEDLRYFHEFAEQTGYQVMLQPGGLGSVASVVALLFRGRTGRAAPDLLITARAGDVRISPDRFRANKPGCQ